MNMEGNAQAGSSRTGLKYIFFCKIQKETLKRSEITNITDMSELIRRPTDDEGVEFDTFGTTEMVQVHKQDAEGFMWIPLDASHERGKGDENGESEDEDDEDEDDEDEDDEDEE